MEYSEIKSTITNAYPAQQFKAIGSMDKIQMKWLFTTVDAPKDLHQIVAWSSPSRFENNRETFTELVNSFKEIEGTQTPAEAPSKK